MFLRRLSLKLLVLLLVSARQAEAYTPLQVALDDLNLNFTSASSPEGTPWVSHTTGADCLDETDGAKSPALSKAGDSWIETTVTGPDTIDFLWSLQTTAPNTLTCTLDGTVKASCPPSDAGRWSHASVVIPEGSHTVRWNYKQTGNAPGKALLDCVGQAGDNIPSLMESPYLQVLAGEPVNYRFATKQPAVLWEVYWDNLPPGLTLDPQTG
ncbi:MAG TPA: hypothetical protein VHM91_13765, partial [Verrucomicrobiales bacterium]|nr:hypothetical protein [Verrucomicrobiales bacterium]